MGIYKMITRNPLWKVFRVAGQENNMAHVSPNICRYVFQNLTKKRNVTTAISIILIQEYGQSNAT